MRNVSRFAKRRESFVIRTVECRRGRCGQLTGCWLSAGVDAAKQDHVRDQTNHRSRPCPHYGRLEGYWKDERADFAWSFEPGAVFSQRLGADPWGRGGFLQHSLQ